IYAANLADTVSVISGRTNTVTATIPLPAGSFPVPVAANPRTNTIYVGNQRSDTVSVISGRTNTVVATVPVGSVPAGVAANPQAKTVDVTNSDDNTVSVLTSRRR